MPALLATWSAPARTALATGLPWLLVKTARVSALAPEGPSGMRTVITVANQAPWYFIVTLPAGLLFCFDPIRNRRSRRGQRSSSPPARGAARCRSPAPWLVLPVLVDVTLN